MVSKIQKVIIEEEYIMKKTKTNANMGAFLFGDYTYEDTVINVTDPNGCNVQVYEHELISTDIPVERHKHVKVYYDNQKYWLPREFHFPQ